jgi:hypothetical protein
VDGGVQPAFISSSQTASRPGSAQVALLVVEDRRDLVVGERVRDLDRVGGDLDRGAGNGQDAEPPAASRRARNERWSGKMLSSSPVITLNPNSSGSRNAGGPALGTTARASMVSTYRIAR